MTAITLPTQCCNEAPSIPPLTLTLVPICTDLTDID
jgi:hypothetical protein